MNYKKFLSNTAAMSFVSLSFFLSGCSSPSVSNTANMPNSNQSAVVSNTVNPVNTNVSSNISTTNVNGVSAANAGNASPAPNANRKPAQAVKEPTPQIGSGGSDLLLFTQARSALSFDRELQTGVIIEVKEGNVTLSGKAPSAEQKAKVEQLIKAINGVKSVKNNITVTK